MTLFLTNTCHYALLVAIEDGKRQKKKTVVFLLRCRELTFSFFFGNVSGRSFISDPSRELFIKSQLDFALPPDVDDLILPNTLICTQPVECTSTPRWRTVLVYFLSAKILRRFKRYPARVTLDVCSFNEHGDTDELGRIELPIKGAQFVHNQTPYPNDDEGGRQIKHYVLDKGHWGSLNRGRGQIRVGLFVSKMSPTANDRNKEMATPLRRPVSTATAITRSAGTSTPSPFTTSHATAPTTATTTTTTTTGTTLKQPPMMELRPLSRCLSPSTASLSSQQACFFNIRICHAIFIPHLRTPPPVVECLFECDQWQCPATFYGREWHVDKSVSSSLPSSSPHHRVNSNSNNNSNHNNNNHHHHRDYLQPGNDLEGSSPGLIIQQRGDLADLRAWMDRKRKITVHFAAVYADGFKERVGYSRINLSDIPECGNAFTRSFPVYDHQREIQIIDDEFSRLTVRLELYEEGRRPFSRIQ